jgi:hypothetical protein
MRERGEGKIGHTIEPPGSNSARVRDVQDTHTASLAFHDVPRQKFGYEVLVGVPQITRSNHPRHDWSV